jgi:hypothetical protein
MDVEPVDAAAGRQVAQPLQRRADEGAAAVALVEEAHLRVRREAVVAQAFLQGFELAGDRPGFRLLIGGNPGVQSRT